MSSQHQRRCPSFGLSVSELITAACRAPSGVPDWPQFRDRHVAMTQSCRTAIYMLREALALEEGDEVLVSAYNCGTEIDALIASGLKVQCVEPDSRGFLSLEAIRHAITPKTRLIYIIHQFGWPQPLEQINAWRKQQGLLLAEDCALSLFSDLPDGSPIGMLGDASVFSFPKSLPVPDGGAISWTTDWAGPGRLSLPPFSRTSRQLLSLVKAWLRRLQKAPQGMARGAAKIYGDAPAEVVDIPEDYYFQPWRAGRACAGITARLLRGTEPLQIKQRRRENYHILSQQLLQDGAAPLFPELPDGVCPLCCPVIVEGRDRAVSALSERGIYSTPWWAGGHRSVEWGSYPQANSLKTSILPLPVHHQLTEADMEYIARIVVSLC